MPTDASLSHLVERNDAAQQHSYAFGAVPTRSVQLSPTSQGMFILALSRSVFPSSLLLRGFKVLDVPEQKDDHHYCHENRIEDVEEDLMRDQIATIALQVLDHSENAPDQDEAARSVQHIQVSPPRDSAAVGYRRRSLDNSNVEEDRGADEESEDHNLREETSDDDILADVVEVQRSAGLYAT